MKKIFIATALVLAFSLSACSSGQVSTLRQDLLLPEATNKNENITSVDSENFPADVFSAFAVSESGPQVKYLAQLIFGNNFFKNFEILSSASIKYDADKDSYSGIIFNDINGDGFYDIWVLNPNGGTVRYQAYFSLISNAKSRQFEPGPILNDQMAYLKDSDVVDNTDGNACFGDCAYQEIYRWLGSNLLQVYSASWDNEREGENVGVKNLKINYELKDGVDAIPLNLQKVISYALKGKMLKFKEQKVTDQTKHYWFEIVDPGKEKPDTIYITEFNGFFDLTVGENSIKTSSTSCYRLDERGLVLEMGC